MYHHTRISGQRDRDIHPPQVFYGSLGDFSLPDPLSLRELEIARSVVPSSGPLRRDAELRQHVGSDPAGERLLLDDKRP